MENLIHLKHTAWVNVKLLPINGTHSFLARVLIRTMYWEDSQFLSSLRYVRHVPMPPYCFRQTRDHCGHKNGWRQQVTWLLTKENFDLFRKCSTIKIIEDGVEKYFPTMYLIKANYFLCSLISFYAVVGKNNFLLCWTATTTTKILISLKIKLFY